MHSRVTQWKAVRLVYVYKKIFNQLMLLWRRQNLTRKLSILEIYEFLWFQYTFYFINSSNQIKSNQIKALKVLSQKLPWIYWDS